MPPPSTRACPCAYLWLVEVRRGRSASHSREQEVTGLGAVEGDGQGGVRRAPQDRAGVAVHARRDIDRDHRHIGLLDRLDRLARHALERAGQTRAEQPVDHQPRAGDQRGVEGKHLAQPRRGRGGGVAAQPLARTEQGESHRPAEPGEMPRGHETVAAVIAGAAQHEGRAGREAFRDRSGDRRARIVHELDARHARGDGGGIGRAHLGDGEQTAVPADRRRAWFQRHRTGRPPIRRWRDGRTWPARSPPRPAGRH
jgi:hypothetical protein